MRLSKRMRIMHNTISSAKLYNVMEGISLFKELSTVKFVESVDVAIHLGIDSRKSDQNIRGNTFLPHGLGRVIRIVVFTQGINVNLAKDSGADLVGLNDLFDFVVNKKNRTKFDVIIASPDVMGTVGQLGSVLGPRGLMPNIKFGTITENIAETVRKIKSGHIRYRNDKNGIVHSSVGKLTFESQALKENIEALILDLKKCRPSNSKGVYFKQLVMSTTMGVSVPIDLNSLNVFV